MPLEKELGKAILKRCLAEPELLKFAGRMYATRHSTAFENEGNVVTWANLIDQRFNGGDSIVQGYCTGAVDLWMHEGRCAVFGIEAGCEPHRDRERQANHKVLASLEDPFSGEISASNDGPDGYLSWNVEHPESPHLSLPTWRSLQAGCAPIEIGFCPGERTLYYLRSQGAIVRWPYGSTWLYLIVLRDDLVGINIPEWKAPECAPR